MAKPRMAIPSGAIRAFCQKWKVKELSLFGSALREDFGPDSDSDILVTFKVWDLVARDIGPLIAALEPLVPPDEAEELNSS